MTDFKKGDIVKLKSGGPRMTVSTVGDYAGGMGIGPEDEVACVWFDLVKGVQKPQERVFDAAVLEHAGNRGLGASSVGGSF
jgi:uncharacterized protein YodC (DUF2158 family)